MNGDNVLVILIIVLVVFILYRMFNGQTIRRVGSTVAEDVQDLGSDLVRGAGYVGGKVMGGVDYAAGGVDYVVRGVGYAGEAVGDVIHGGYDYVTGTEHEGGVSMSETEQQAMFQPPYQTENQDPRYGPSPNNPCQTSYAPVGN